MPRGTAITRELLVKFWANPSSSPDALSGCIGAGPAAKKRSAGAPATICCERVDEAAKEKVNLTLGFLT